MRKWVLLSFALLALFGANARAEDIQVALKATLDKGAPKSKATFRATIRNTTKKPLFLNQISVSFANHAALQMDPAAFYASFQKPIPAEGKVADAAIFAVEKGALKSASPTASADITYFGTLTLLGGADGKALKKLAQKDFRLSFSGREAPKLTIDRVTPGNGQSASLVITLKNLGSDIATECEITSATLSSIRAGSGSTLPLALADIAPGADSAPVTLSFPGSVSSGRKILALIVRSAGRSQMTSRLVTLP